MRSKSNYLELTLKEPYIVKFLKLLLLTLLILTFIGGVYFYMNFGDISKRAVEKVASNALNVSVKISKLDLSLSEKSVTVSGIRIANPPGYKSKNIVEVGAVAIILAEVPENYDLIKFKLFDVKDALVNLEVKQKTTNLTDLKNGMSRSSSKRSGSDTKVILNKFHINQSKLNPTITLIADDLGSIKIPPVTLRGIGTKENGVLAEEAIKQIITQYFDIAQNTAQSSGYLEGLAGVDIKKEVDKIKTQAKNKIKDNIGNFLQR